MKHRTGIGAALAAIAVASCLGLAAGPAVAKDEVNGATIQWAQTILDQKGFYNGRATSKMDAPTITAITQFQKKSGLKATGRLDAATIEKLKEGREQDKTVGNLADPTSRAKPSQPRLREEDVKPTAAPAAAGVEAVGGPVGESLISGFGGGRAGEPAPVASPRTQLQAALPHSPSGGPGGDAAADPAAAPRAAIEAEGGGGGVDLRNMTAPEWVRYGIIGLVVVLLSGMGVTWWSSGRRRPAARKVSGADRGPGPGPGDGRREPVFGGTARPDGRVEPTLRTVQPGGGQNGPGVRAGRL